MTPDNDNLRPGEEILLKTRPAWRSFWVFILGLLICGVGPFLSERPPLSPVTGIIAAVVFALVILRRWSNVYTLTDQRIMVRGGLGVRETTAINLADLVRVETHQGFTTSLVGTGHLVVLSRVPHEESILVYGQPDHLALKERIEGLAAEVRRKEPDPPEG